MGMRITIAVEEDLEGHKLLQASRCLTDQELDYASFDLPCHTIKKLREEIEREKEEYLRSQERTLDA